MYKKQPKLLSDDQKKVLINALPILIETLDIYDPVVSEMCEKYFVEAARQNESGELTTHLNGSYAEEFDFRHGADTVMGTLGQYLVHACYAREGYRVEIMTNRESQRNEMDLKLHRTDEVPQYSSVKNNYLRANGTIRLGADYFRNVGPQVNFIDFADLNVCEVYHFHIDDIADYFFYNRNPANDNDYIYKRLIDLPEHKVFTLWPQ
jgi:hypothetical protein